MAIVTNTRLTSSGIVCLDYEGNRLTSGGIVKGIATAAGDTDVLFQNMFHQIDSGLITQTASGLNGVLIT